MQQNKLYKKTGLFVVIGFACLIVVIFNYVGQKFTTDDKDLVVMYFEESIQGLSVGSSVVLQGVEIGQVNRIKLIANVQQGTFQTPVYVLFDKKKIMPIGKVNDSEAKKAEVLDRLVEKGLKARLVGANLLTGQLMIELIMDPDQKPVMRGTGRFREIPTVLSAYAKFSEDLKDIPLRETLTRMGDVLLDLDDKLPTILNNVANITGKFNNMLNKKSGEVSKTLTNANATMEEISKASRSIKNLTDYLERHPEAILKGKEK